MKSFSVRLCKFHLIKAGIVKRKLLHRCVHPIFSLALRQFIASVIAWDYSKVALTLHGIYTMRIALRKREKKKTGFSSKIFQYIV